MVVTPPEVSQNLFFDEFYWRTFGTNRDGESGNVIDPPKNRALVYTE
ncbi:hypothetical protein AC33_2069 [Escherichia coli 3-267-03_S3_C2]|nr:hypothetical protein AC33_2069 [Escherichia coli 3-267-03_S3_C2]